MRKAGAEAFSATRLPGFFRISPPQQVPMDKDRALFLSVFWEEETAGQAAVGMTP